MFGVQFLHQLLPTFVCGQVTYRQCLPASRLKVVLLVTTQEYHLKSEPYTHFDRQLPCFRHAVTVDKIIGTASYKVDHLHKQLVWVRFEAKL